MVEVLAAPEPAVDHRHEEKTKENSEVVLEVVAIRSEVGIPTKVEEVQELAGATATLAHPMDAEAVTIACEIQYVVALMISMT